LPLHRLTRGRLPLSALMIGAMSPDFAYFISFVANRTHTHDLAGLFTFCLPVGLAVWLLFVRVLEQPTVALLPEPWRSRFTRAPDVINVHALLFASLGILLGAMSHIAWDSFTHAFTPVTDVFPILRSRLFTLGGVTVRIFWALQILSSIFGLVVLMIWALKSPAAGSAPARHSPYAARISNAARVGAALAVLAISGGVAVMGYLDHPYASFESRVFFLLMGGMKGFVVAWAAIAVFVQRYLRAAQRPLAPVWSRQPAGTAGV
jgi:uncharacterized protein DUF4184